MGVAKRVVTATDKFRGRSFAVRDTEWLREALGQRWRNISELRLRRSFLCESPRCFLLGKDLHRFLSHSKMPARDGEHLTPATKLLEKRREVAEVEQALATQKEVIS